MASSRLSLSSSQSRNETALPVAKSPYTYKALTPGSIRILVLLPGSFGQGIHIALFEIPLESAEDMYDALSYTWAPLSPAQAIFCEGREISVTANLYDALVALQWESEQRFLWIDQITINQQDHEEKGSQVALMGTIYSKATQVLVWLSNHLWKDGRCVNDLSKSYDQIRSVITSGDASVNSAGEKLLPCFTQLPPESWNSLLSVYQSNYLRRVWMVQEIVLAKQCVVMLSGRLVGWESLELLGIWLRTVLPTLPLLSLPQGALPIPETLTHSTSSLLKIATIRQRLYSSDNTGFWHEQQKWTLLDLVRKSWNFEATDARDKIYAVSGLLAFENHCIPTSIAPDYTRAMTFDRLVRRVFVEGIVEQGSLESLLYCTDARKDLTPSWMAGIDTQFRMPYEIGVHYKKWEAGGHRQHIRYSSITEFVLSFRITRLANISHVVAAFPGALTMDEKMAMPRQWARPIDIETVREYIAQIIGLPPRGMDGPSGATFKDDFYQAFFCGLSLDFERSNSQSSALTSVLSDKYEDKNNNFGRLASLIQDMRFGCAIKATASVKPPGANTLIASLSFEEPAPLMCWFPLETKIGDLICIVHGFNLPMVVRPVPGHAERYCFVGLCYAHRFMDGEALTDHDLVTEDIAIA